MKLCRTDILDLLRSGDFTITYHDNQSPSLYRKKWEYEDLDGAEEIEFKLDNYDYGYCPAIVGLLVEALNGKSDSV